MLTSEEIALSYESMGDSVNLINGIVNGEKFTDESLSRRQDYVRCNVEHLQLMVSKDFWTTEDMTAVNAAIVAGNNYLS